MNGRLIWKVIVTCVLPCLVATQSPRAVLSTPRFSETDVRLSPSACKSFEVVCNIGTPFTSRMEWVIRTHRLPPAISTNETTRRMIYDSPVSINFTFDLTAYRILLICNADDQDGKLVWSGYISFQVNKTVENRWDDYKDAVTCDKTDDGVKSTNGSNGVVLLPTNASQQINGSLTSSGSSVYTTGHYTTSHPTTRLPTPSSVVNPTETSTLPSQSDAMPMWIYFVIPPVALILILICVVVIYFKRKGKRFLLLCFHVLKSRPNSNQKVKKETREVVGVARHIRTVRH
eukprot:m.105517 g.105517  ORF g.105517 m.105517 type:complete len:288 (+) comp37229_c0_seq1:84-947(+)